MRPAWTVVLSMSGLIPISEERSPCLVPPGDYRAERYDFPATYKADL